MGHERIVDVPKATGVGLVPLVGLVDTVLPAHLLSPSQIEQAVRVDVVAKIVEHTVLDECHAISLRAGISRKLDQLARHIDVGLLVGAADVVDHTHLALEQNDFKSTSNIFHKEKVALVGAGAVQCDGSATHQLVDELWDEFLRILMRAIHIVTASDDDGHAERAVVRLG